MHLCYEIRMLFEGFERMRQVNLLSVTFTPGVTDFVQCATIESALIHARLLHEFFNSTRATARSDDDIVPEDLWTTVPPGLPVGGSLPMPDLHKRLAHLSHARTPRFEWRASQILGPLLPSIRHACEASIREPALSAQTGQWRQSLAACAAWETHLRTGDASGATG